MTRIIVCGSRTWTDRDAIWRRLNDLPRPVTIVHGDASGADSLADAWAHVLIFSGGTASGVSLESHPADWKQYGLGAGPRRNSEMAALGADLCIAFRMPGKSNGTDDMVRKAGAAGIPVEVVKP